MVRVLCFVLGVAGAFAQSMEDRAQHYLIDLIRLDTSNLPGNETIVAEYVHWELGKEGIPCEILDGDPQRMNVICRLKGGTEKRPLLLMAHSDVIPIEPKLWTVPAFEGLIKDGFIYGRGRDSIAT